MSAETLVWKFFTVDKNQSKANQRADISSELIWSFLFHFVATTVFHLAVVTKEVRADNEEPSTWCTSDD